MPQAVTVIIRVVVITVTRDSHDSESRVTVITESCRRRAAAASQSEPSLAA